MSEPVIPYGRQDIDAADIAAVVAVLQSDFLTQGPAVPAFEQTVADYCGARHAVAVNSATSALHIACLSLGLGPGDRLWTTPNTFVASANCARYCGADVDFVDIEAGTRNLCINALRAKLAAAEKTGTLPKIVVPVAFAGLPTDLQTMRELADHYGFAIIDDASHAIGGRYRNQPVGGSGLADITIFSFHPVKIVTTGEGGMALTDDAGLAARMQSLRSHGITRDAARFEQASDGPWYYEMQELGWNYRMTDLQATLGNSQMQRLDQFVARRSALAGRYDRLLADCGLELPGRSPDAASAWHLYPIGWNAARSGIDRRTAFEKLRAAGIGVNVHYLPVHLQPYYRRLGFAPGQYPVAEDYYRRTITLPLFPGLSENDQDRVVACIKELAG